MGPENTAPMFERGRLLAGRYELLDKIGEGGAAEVYRARDTRLDRIIAIKLLRPQFINEATSRKRFINEARTAAGLSHPNIVDVYDFGEGPDGSMFIAMQYVEGHSLKELIQKRGRLPAAEVVSLIPQVCRALSAAHANGLIHRDVKPQNILIDRKGNAHLADFGIVKALSGPDLTQTGMTFGTAAYLSPEQATGEPIGPASDIYALGCVMYEMLSGAPPFTGDNPAVVAYKQVWEQPTPLHERVPEVPPSLESVIMRCLNKEPSRRYPSTDALAADLVSLGAAFNQPTQAMALGSMPSSGNRGGSTSANRPSAETMHPIPMPNAPSRVPPVKAQTTGATGSMPIPIVTPQPTRRIEPQQRATRAASVQVVHTQRRGSNMVWAPLALVVLIGLGLCGFTAWQGNGFFGLFGGNRTPIPTPTVTLSTPTPSPTLPRSTATLAVIIKASPTATMSEPTATQILAPTDTPTRIPTETPTDTPVPTLQPPPTITPAPPPPPSATPLPVFTPVPIDTPTPTPELPPPTDTPVLQEPTATTEPSAPPISPTDTTIPGGDKSHSITLEDSSFHGGDAGSYHGRSAQWVYGQGTQYSAMSASFDIADTPHGPGTLTIVGLDSEDTPKTPVRISINGATIYDGQDPLPNDTGNGPAGPGNWGSISLRIQPKVLVGGANTITITNLDPSTQIHVPIFVMIDYVIVSW